MIPRKDGLEIEGRGMIKLEDAIVGVVVLHPEWLMSQRLIHCFSVETRIRDRVFRDLVAIPFKSRDWTLLIFSK